jgi:hypothetical protein
MITRFNTWRVRRKAKYLSRYSCCSIIARIGEVTVGEFRRGKEVKR